MYVMVGQGLDREKFDKVFDEAVKAYPKHNAHYTTKLWALLPRWYGEEGEWEKFAAASGNKIGGIDGDVLYTRLIIHVIRNFGEELKTAPPDIKRVERGMAELQRRYPGDPAPKAVLCRIYYTTGNKQKARQLFNEIGTNVPKVAFDTKGSFLDFWKEFQQN